MRRGRAALTQRSRSRSDCGDLRRRPRSLGTPRPGDRDDDARESQEPRERLLRVDTCGALRPAERRMREQRDPELITALDHPTAERTVVEGVECHLDGGDGRELQRLVEPAAVDVREPDPPHEAFVGKPRERTHRRLPRRARIGCVKEVEVDRKAVERGEARLAVGEDRLGPAVRDPRAAGPGHAALRHDSRGLRRAAEAQGAREQLLVAVVRSGGVEDRHARLRSGSDRLGRKLGREAHAAEADAELRRPEPGRRHADGCRNGTTPCQPRAEDLDRDGGVISATPPSRRGRRSA